MKHDRLLLDHRNSYNEKKLQAVLLCNKKQLLRCIQIPMIQSTHQYTAISISDMLILCHTNIEN